MAPPKLTAVSARKVDGSKPPHARLSAEKRREQLIEVALDLFSQKGFSGTTTREVAVAAGVTEAIIFRHFATKEHLYKAIIDRCLGASGTAEWLAELEAAMLRNDDEAVIRQLIAGIILMHKTSPKLERLMLYAALEGNQVAMQHMRQVTADIVLAFTGYFNRRKKQGALTGAEPEVSLAAIVGMAQHYARGRYIHKLKDNCISDEQAVESFTRLALNGIRARKVAKKR